MARRLRKKQPTAKQVRRARSLDDVTVVVPPVPSAATLARTSFTLRATEVRRQAAQDYITDGDGRDVRYWYEREDRPYRNLVKFSTFSEWASADQWTTRRERWWYEVEYKILQSQQHKLIVQRLKEVNELTESTDSMQEYLRPLKDAATGAIKRHPPKLDSGDDNPLSGLPIFPLELPPMDKFGKMWIELSKLLMMKRGEATSRSEEVPKTGAGSSLDPVTQAVPFSREDIRALARHALELRQPELVGEVLEVLQQQDVDQEDDDRAAVEEGEEEDGT